MINESFLMQGRNIVFMQDLILPAPLVPVGDGLTFELETPARGNITMDIPEIGLNRATFTEIVFQEVLGVYECEVFNIYGRDIAQSTIRECGEFLCLFFLPGPGPGLGLGLGHECNP